LNSETATEKLKETILQIVAQKKPETVGQLVELVSQTHTASQGQILEAIVKLQNQGRLQLTTPEQPVGASAYMKTSAAFWFWATIALELGTLGAAFTIPINDFPLVYIRYVLGAVFIFGLPGYTLTKALFPRQLPYKTSDKDLDTIVRIALSVGLSIALVSLVGLLLYYTPWGINLTPVILSLITLTTIFAIAGLMRERRVRTQKKA
jgi:hypothetical protein